jgi:hypothetical protein
LTSSAVASNLRAAATAAAETEVPHTHTRTHTHTHTHTLTHSPNQDKQVTTAGDRDFVESALKSYGYPPVFGTSPTDADGAQ